MRDKLLKIESFSDFFKRKKKPEPGTGSASLGRDIDKMLKKSKHNPDLEPEVGFTSGYRNNGSTPAVPLPPSYQPGDYLLVDTDPDEVDDAYVVRVINFKPNPETEKPKYLQRGSYYICEPIDTYQKPLPTWFAKYDQKMRDIYPREIIKRLTSEEIAKIGLKPTGRKSIRNAFK